MALMQLRDEISRAPEMQPENDTSLGMLRIVVIRKIFFKETEKGEKLCKSGGLFKKDSHGTVGLEQ